MLQNAAMDALVPLGVWHLGATAPDGIEIMLDGRPLAPQERPLQRAAARGESAGAMELEVRVPGKPARFVLASAEPLWTEDGRSRGAIGAAVDVTQRKHGEAERASMMIRAQSARLEAEAANRAKDEFLAMLGHELRNPLNAIATSIEVLNRVDASTSIAMRAREIISNQTRKLAHTMDRLLSVGQVIASGVELLRQPVDLAGLAQRAIAAAQPKAAAKQQALRGDLSDTWVHADAQRIGEVLEQLLDNAIRYTPPGGTVDVQVRCEEDRALLRVRDSGPGIAPALLPHLFEPFVQGERSLDRRAGGLGIGLTLVKRLVEMHGGSVDASSSAQGTIFEVRLPLSKQANENADGEIDHQPAGSAPAARDVVVIDDDPDVLDGLRSMLELDGHTVVTATDGNTGLALFDPARPDAAVVDIGLPGMNGYELARCARAAGYSGLLIALSGYGQEGDARRALAAGFDVHMVKPVDARELARLLAKCGPCGSR